MPFYPIWSLTYIAISVLVIYALAAYEAKPRPCSRPGAAVRLPSERATLLCPLSVREWQEITSDGQWHPDGGERL